MIPDDIQPLEILHALGIDEFSSVTPLQGGQDMAMWKVEWGEQPYALRVFPPGEHARCEHERAVMTAVHAVGLPAPEVRVSGVWRDHPVLLITWLSGRMLSDELRLHPWRLWRLGRAFGRMQAAIHMVPVPAHLLRQPDAWITWQCKDEPVLQERLRRLASDPPTLLHLDYHPNNVLTDGKQITGVVDWVNAHAGDPRADLARTLSILRVAPQVRKPLLWWLGLQLFAMAWHLGYQHERGKACKMPPFYAWAGTVMLHDQEHRYRDRPHELLPARRWANKWKRRSIC